jgi:hypothetical protein
MVVRRYMFEGRTVTWAEFASANEPETMEEIGKLAVGEKTVLGQCDEIERLPDALSNATIAAYMRALVVVPIEYLHTVRACTYAGRSTPRIVRPGHHAWCGCSDCWNARYAKMNAQHTKEA